jgi:hypothetical protein
MNAFIVAVRSLIRSKWLARVMAGALITGGCGVFALAQAPATIKLQITEMAGIRRNQFPVSTGISLKQGELKDPAHLKLLLGATEVPVQATADSRWPDGSVSTLMLDFNASPGPAESLNYTLQYGDGVASSAAARGLTVTEDATGFQVGNVRFNKSASPLIASVKYRDEAIAAGLNGLTIVDANGQTHDLSSVDNLSATLVKQGPLVATIRYAGTLAIGGTNVPVTLSVEMPSSKSWVKLTARVSSRTPAFREIALSTPFSVGSPVIWDFGTSRWTYGSLRNAGDRVIMTTTVRSASESTWRVTATTAGRDQEVERSAGTPTTLGPAPPATFAGWGHVQGAKEVVAFAVGGIDRPGTHRLSVDGSGQTSFRFEAAQPLDVLELTVYEHFVSTPVQIGAATSPAAILSPLSVGILQ